MLSKLSITILIVFAAVPACSNEFDETVAAVKAEDERNVGVDFSLSRERESLVFNLTSVEADKSPMDVFRVFLQTAAAIQTSSFDEVILAYKSDKRFRLAGEDFQGIGKEFATQNPMYTLRTFPEKLMTMNGDHAFPTRTGGLLYLARAQMEDFSAFNKQWYFADLKAAYEEELQKGLPESYEDDEAL